MPQPGRHFFASARGRLLFFNLLVVAVTLMVSGVAVLGFQHASQIQEQVQQQTVDDMTGSMNLARDTANVATAAVRLSQVVGALEYKGEAERLQETQRALKHSLERLASAPLAQREPVLVERIIQRSNELQSSVEGMLQRGQRRHLERNALLSSLYQNQSYLRHLQTLTGAQDDILLGQIDRLIVAAIETPTPRSVVKQLDGVMTALPLHHSSPLISRILNDFNQELHKLEPLSSALEQSDLAINWYMFHIKALVAILNSDINQYASQVALISEQRVVQSHQELQSGALFIMVFALLAVVITGFAGWYIYRNLGSNLTAISQAMTRLAHGESDVSVPALQRRDELGELARAFSVFARNTASLEHTTRLLKEKTSQMEIDRTERQELEEALLHSQKLKAVGQLTGGLAHDFNNLLAVIIGSLDLVNPDSPDAPRVNRALKAAERGALLTQRLLTQRLLAFSRKQSLHPHAVELKTLLENLGELMRHSLPATLTLEIEAQSPAWPAWIDVSQLENAIINLVMNARDAMDGQAGTIKIRTWNQRVTRSDGRKQDMVMLEVADQGCGMSQEVKAQVFEPFFTTKQTGSGSGLGLSMVYGFVRQSGGRVEIESAPGQGTTVRLQLPRAVVLVQAEAEPIAEHAANSGEKLVLVLEDEADVRQTLCEQLHLLGYLTLEAANGEQAMHMLAASSEIDIFISDVMLPGGLSGVDVVNHAQAHYPQLNILLMSGQDLRPAHNPALPDVALLRKPFTRTELAQALRHLSN
ncbi:ATP-binding protein [Citrobacter werkmanii]|uniref:hybrid sensor histidine kinase/response regulator n=2 Tax=Enterobacterales TaxID=91347 RepID=UPI00271C083F|nr:hybrid sensor histidine kinase/response regulator [Citrobacter werkmanii]MDO8236360.1 ATP-binding protein [Citrobacter werkmanii]